MKSMMGQFVFSVEPTDRSVGIMSEGFCAWKEGGTSWVNLDELGIIHPVVPSHSRPTKFTWYDNETGDECTPPGDAAILEELLLAFVEAWYEQYDIE